MTFYVTGQENMEEQKLHNLNFPWICCFFPWTSTSLNLFSTSPGKNQRNNFSINQYLFIIISIKFKKLFFSCSTNILVIVLMPLLRTLQVLDKQEFLVLLGWNINTEPICCCILLTEHFLKPPNPEQLTEHTEDAAFHILTYWNN